MDIVFTQSRNIQDYKPLLQELPKEFGDAYFWSPLQRCGLIERKADTNFWEVYLIKESKTKQVIGTCGLYAIFPNYTKELWLSRFSILPAYRGTGIGTKALDFLSKTAKSVGADTLMSYVDTAGGPLPFYYKNGFSRVSSVGEYIQDKNIKNLDWYFDQMNDHVIKKAL